LFYSNDSVGNLNSVSLSFENKQSVTTPGTPAGGTGGGGGGAPLVESFSVNQELVSMVLTQGFGDSVSLGFTNRLTSTNNLRFSLTGLDGISVLYDKELSLNSDELKLVKFDFFAPTSINPGIYTGRLTISGQGMSKTINIVIEVRERNALFDIKATIYDFYKKVTAGGKISSKIDMSNIGLRGQPVDVALRLSVLDFDKNVVYETNEEMLAVTNTLSIDRSINLPQDIPLGDYILLAKIIYSNATAESFDTFNVVEKADVIKQRISYISYIVFLVLIILLIIYITMRIWEEARKGKYEQESANLNQVVRQYRI
jgi:hypothetical protein